MRKYWKLAEITWQRAMVYRANTILEFLGYLATMLVSITLWNFAFLHTGQGIIGGYTEREMMLYLLVAGWFTSSFWFTAQGDRVVREIKEGKISNYLVKPLRVSGYYFVFGTVGKLSQFLWSSIAFLVLVFAFRLYPLFYFGDVHVGAFAVFFIAAWFIQWLIFYTAALLAFWMEEVWGITFTIRVLADIAAGAFLPLSLFAPFWQNVFDMLPFKYIIAVPVNALLGRLPLDKLLPTLGGAIVWLIVLALLSHIAMRRGIRRYSAVGG